MKLIDTKQKRHRNIAYSILEPTVVWTSLGCFLMMSLIQKWLLDAAIGTEQMAESNMSRRYELCLFDFSTSLLLIKNRPTHTS